MGEIAARDEDGRFIAGASGNPAGRPVGTRNATTMVKEFITHALVNELQEDAIEILQVAIKKAKDGDNAMIKLLLKDLLIAAGDEDTSTGDVVIRITNMTLKTNPDGITIENEEEQ